MTEGQPAYERFMRAGPLTISAAYFLISLLWIWVSDAYIFGVTSDSAMILELSRLKGFGFVIVTAVLLYLAITYFANLLGRRDEEIRKNYEVLVKNTAELEESEQKKRQLLESMRDAYDRIDIEGRFVEWNSAFQEMVGYSGEELRNLKFTDIMPEKQREEARATADRILERGYSDIFEREFLRKDGTVFPVELRVFVIKDDDGKPAGMWAIVRDISERKTAELALKLVNQKLQLMNIVAWHDIQNKVTGLRGYIELSKDLISDEKVGGYLKTEEEILRVIHNQIASTQEYQEIGSRPLRWIPIAETMVNVRDQTGTGGIGFKVDVDGLEIFGDPVLEKVIRHLVENSITHGGTVSTISLTSQESPTGMTLVYEDNGTGIPPGKKPGLFTKSFGQTTEFGLFFVHDALEISGMGIIENGEPGKGVRFEISVPKGLYRYHGK